MSSRSLFSDRVTAIIGGKQLFDTEISINATDKICIMGANGTGKTTLINTIYDKLSTVIESLIYIKQDTIIEDSNDTILSYVLKANLKLYNDNIRYSFLSNLERDLTDEEQEELDALSQSVGDGEWERYNAHINKILNGLQITNIDRKMELLSGGWKTRVALAKALAIKPTLLILDEPTNHLDLNGVIWLRNFLNEYKKAIIVVTHMKTFADYVSNNIWYITDLDGTGQKIYKVRGGTDNVKETLEQTQNEITKKWDKFQKQIKELQKKSTPKTQVEQFIKENSVPRPLRPVRNHFIFPDVGNYGSRNILELNDVSFKYSELSRSLFKKISLGISNGSRYVLVGDNGVGKTTLFKLCNGDLKPTSGDVYKDTRVKTSVYNQDIVSSLDLTKSPIQFLTELYGISVEQSRSYLGKVGIKKEDHFDPCVLPIENLSGGYKARMAFCKIILEDPSVILLDEPTNHLDIDTIQSLILGLNNYNGGILVITHDLDFIKGLENCQVLKLHNKQISIYNDIDDYIDEVEESLEQFN
jgi:ATPase subunit of ABC transporter with duplicated ATPase domains